MGARKATVHRATAAFTHHGPQLRGSMWLLLAVVTNAAGGFFFWLVAARLYDADAFGSAAALFTAVQFVNYATNLGFPVAVGRFARGSTVGAHRLFNLALIATTLSSVVGSVIVLALLPEAVTDPLWGQGRAVGFLVFSLIVIGMSFTVIGEVRLMAMRRWSWVLARAGLVAVIRIPLIWLHPLDSDALWLFLLVAGVPAISGVIIAAALARADHGWDFRPLPSEARAALRFAAVNYLGLLALQAPLFALPVIVLVNVSASTMASFYIAFSITTVAFLVPHTLGQVLLVEGGNEDRDPRAQVRLAMVLAVGAMVLATIGSIGLAHVLTAIYGADFQAAANALPWLVGASVPWAVTAILLTRARLDNATGPTLAITGTLAVMTLAPALLLIPDHGIAGATVAWISGNLAAALVALGAGGVVLRRAATSA